MRVSKLAIVCPSALVMGLTTSCLNFALVFYSHDKFGADTFQASLFGSLYSLSYLFCCSFGGKLLQKIPPLKSIIASLCCCIIGLFLMINAPSLRHRDIHWNLCRFLLAATDGMAFTRS